MQNTGHFKSLSFHGIISLLNFLKRTETLLNGFKTVLKIVCSAIRIFCFKKSVFMYTHPLNFSGRINRKNIGELFSDFNGRKNDFLFSAVQRYFKLCLPLTGINPCHIVAVLPQESRHNQLCTSWGSVYF